MEETDKHSSISTFSLPPLVGFTPLEYELPDVKDLIGSLKSESRESVLEMEETSDRSTKGMQFYQPKLIRNIENGGASLLLYTDNELWTYEFRRIIIYNKDGKVKKKIKTKFWVNDMVQTPSKDIIVTDNDNLRLVKISRAGRITTLFKTHRFAPNGLCINDGQQIVVGRNAGYATPPIRLVIYSLNGSTSIQVIENDEDENPLFTREITNVKQNVNGDYVVSDRNILVCLSREGHYRWENVVGCDDIHGLACDQHGNILASDCYNNRVILLDSDGTLIRTLLTVADGMMYPQALVIGREAEVLVGQQIDVKVFKYLE